MGNITVFSGSVNSSSDFRNYIDPFTLKLSSGSIIPTTGAKITKITFSLYLKIYASVNTNLRFLKEVPTTSNGGYDTTTNLALSTNTVAKSSGSDTYQTLTFGGYASNYSYFMGKDSFSVVVGRANRKENGSTAKPYADHPATCTVEWEYTYLQPNKISKVTASPNSIYPGGSVTLSWAAGTMPSGAINTITNYSVYLKKGTEWEHVKDVSGTSTTVTVPATQGTYYYSIGVDTNIPGYCIDPSNGGGSGTDTVTVVSAVSSTTTPTNLQIKINHSGSEYVISSGTVYIGSSGVSGITLTLLWDKANDGVNNAVKSYTVYKNGNVYRSDIPSSATSCEIDKTAGYYTVLAVPTVTNWGNGQSAASPDIKIVDVPSPTKVSLITPNNVVTNENPTIKWNAVGAATGATTYYNIYKWKNNGSTLLTTLTGQTSYTYSLSDENDPMGEEFQIGIQVYNQASNGGYSMASSNNTTWVKIKRASAFAIPTDFWQGCYDSGNDFSTGIYNYAHSNVTLKWSKIVTTDDSQGTIFTHALEYQVNDGNFTSLNSQEQTSTSNDSFSYVLPLSSYAEGTKFGVRVKVSSNFGVSQYSPVLFFTKIVSPSISNFAVSNVDYQKLQASFDYTRYLAADATSLCYDVVVSYGSQNFSIYQGEIDTSSISTEIISGAIKLGDEGIKTDFGNTMADLYKTVITNQQAYPTGAVTLNLWYKAFHSALSSAQQTLNFNYSTIPTSYGEMSFTNSKNNGEKPYYNATDTVEIGLSNFVWKDAAGGTTGAIVSPYLTSSYSSNEFYFNGAIESLKASFIAPQADEDLNNIELTLKVKITYADSKNSTIYDSGIKLLLNIAKWKAETISIESMNVKENRLEGYILLPYDLCSSSQYSNLKNFIPSLLELDECAAVFYDKDGNEMKTTGFTKQDLPTDLRIKFQIAKVDKSIFSDITVVFSFVFTNTSGNTLTVQTLPYRYFQPDLDLAIRKERIGINVSNSFNSNDANKKSALYINASPSAASTTPIVELNGLNDGTVFQSFEVNNISYGNISVEKDGDNAYLTFKGLRPIVLSIDLGANGLEANEETGKPSGVWRIENNHITDFSLQEISFRPEADDLNAAYKRYARAKLVGGSQGLGYAEIIPLGKIPSNDETIPIIMTIMG